MATWKGSEVKYSSDDGLFSINKTQTWEYQTTSDRFSIIIKTDAYAGFTTVPESTQIHDFDYDESRVLVKNVLEWATRYLGEDFVERTLEELKSENNS